MKEMTEYDPVESFMRDTRRAYYCTHYEWVAGKEIFDEFTRWAMVELSLRNTWTMRVFYAGLRSLGLKDRVERSQIKFYVPIKNGGRDILFLASLQFTSASE